MGVDEAAEEGRWCDCDDDDVRNEMGIEGGRGVGGNADGGGGS